MNKSSIKTATIFLPILLASCSSSASQEEINEATKRCGMATMIGLVTKCEVNASIPSMDVRMVLQGTEFTGVCANVANFLREGTKFSEGWTVRIFKQGDSSPAAECKLK